MGMGEKSDIDMGGQEKMRDGARLLWLMVDGKRASAS